MIRVAQDIDIPEIVRLGSQSLLNGPYKGMIKDRPEQSATLAFEVIKNSKGVVLLYENETGKVAGLLGFIIFPHYFTGEQTASEIMWYVEPEERKGGGGIQLLWEAEKVARQMGATRMGFTAPLPTPEVSKLYERFGYKAIETSYMKEL